MPSETGPNRTRFARALRELRRNAGLGGVQAGRLAGMSQSKISKIENGELRPSVKDVRVLCEVYRAAPTDRDELIQLASELQQESRRSRVVLASGASRLQRRIARMEASASLMRSFSLPS